MNCHNHKKHSCECKHENVKYCAKCSLVYCEDCGFEWNNNTWWYYPYQYPTYIQPLTPPCVITSTWGSTNAAEITSGYVDVVK
jgi:hypothetical protein